MSHFSKTRSASPIAAAFPRGGVFVTGTDTGVGKTHVAALLLRELRRRGVSIGAYKPVCSGAVPSGTAGEMVWEDVEALAAALECPGHSPVSGTLAAGSLLREWVCPQRFLDPLAPPVAARAEGKTVDAALLRTGLDVWRGKVDALLVEGAGGWLSPISDVDTVADLAVDLGFPVLIVAANKLGCVNHTLLTIAEVRARGLTVAGVVLNEIAPASDRSSETNLALLREFTDAPIFGPVPYFRGGEDRGVPGDWDDLLSQLGF